MKNTIIVGALALTASVAMLGAGYVAGGFAGGGGAAAPGTDRAAVEAIVRDYLLANPQVLVEMQDALELRQREEEFIAQVETIRAASDDIFDADFDGLYGNPEGDVTVVEFFDYNCGFCKRALQDMQEMVRNDRGLRFVLKEFPILGPDSQRAHVVSMAFRALAPDRYSEFHTTLLAAPGRATEESAIEVARALGVDEEALREEMRNPAIGAAFELNFQLASRLSITGTPSYVIGEEVVFGAVGSEQLGEKIARARATPTRTGR